MSRPRLHRWLRRLGKLALSGVAVAVVVGAALWVAVADRVRLLDPEPTVLLHDRHGRFIGELGADADARLGFWPIDPQALPERVVAATLAIEDRHFHAHPGVDVQAIARAAWQNLRNGERISGASTVPMQVARLQRPAPRTWGNKILEATTALRLVRRFGRERVLAQYLRLAPYGNNVHGVAYAARRYFDKPVGDLSWAETAFLAGLPQAPGLYNPYTEGGRARALARAGRILDLLHERGRLPPAQHRQAQRELADLRVLPRPTRPAPTLHPLFALRQRLPRLRADLRARGGADLPVKTTLDLALQRRVQARLRGALARWAEDGAGNGAVVVVELGERPRVKASVGSADWYDLERAGAIDFTRVHRAPASTLKPFLYAQALERGVITPGTVMDDLMRAGEGIANSDQRFLGPLMPRAALGNSRNVPAVELMQRVGAGTFHALLAELGLHDRAFLGAEGLALAIGGLPVRMIDLVQAYTALAQGGALRELQWYADQDSGAPEQIFEVATARQITRWLSDPQARLPTFPKGGHLELPFPVAVKTGTSGDYRDAWAVAWSPTHLVAVWVGHPQWRPMRGLSGYRAAALMQEIMLDLHPTERSGITNVPFPAPEGWAAASICPLTGHRATAACEHAIMERFPPGRAPEQPCAAHSHLPVDRRTGALAGPDTPASQREMRAFVELPPRYAAWMHQMRLQPPPGRMVADPGLLRDRAPTIRVVSPKPGTQLIRDPDAPAGQSTLQLRATVDSPVEQLVWYVDGQPVAVADDPYTARWPIEPGAHWIEARLPFSDVRSAPVRIVSR